DTLEILLEASPIQVTKNLYTALYSLRYADRERLLWVDALSIDLTNLEERNH
ncbi:uncharacterized protein BDR25DRAFT_217658, partial [Lindgomyces ingoldianus]